MRETYKNLKSPNTFLCFNPPVMLATFAVEILLMLWLLFEYKTSTIIKISSLILLNLGLFQAAEFFVCEGNPEYKRFWAQVGFIAITLLPPLGLHLVQVIAKVKDKALTHAAYVLGGVWIYLILVFDVFESVSCGNNYAIFKLRDPFGYHYGVYYYALLLITVALAVQYRKHVKKPAKTQLEFMVVGYLLFMTPVAVINFISEKSAQGVPSIMCGFAILFALILAFKVAPLGAKRNSR